MVEGEGRSEICKDNDFPSFKDAACSIVWGRSSCQKAWSWSWWCDEGCPPTETAAGGDEKTPTAGSPRRRSEARGNKYRPQDSGSRWEVGGFGSKGDHACREGWDHKTSWSIGSVPKSGWWRKKGRGNTR